MPGYPTYKGLDVILADEALKGFCSYMQGLSLNYDVAITFVKSVNNFIGLANGTI